MRLKGASTTAILAALNEENAVKCKPPLPWPEVAAIATSVGRYAPGSLARTDTGNAERLVGRHGHDLKHVYGLGWFVWAGTHWQRDETGAVERRAKDTVRSIHEEAARVADDAERKELTKWAVASESAGRLRAMISLARSEPGVTALVYVAGFILDVGESTAQLAAKFPGGQLGPALNSVPFPLAGGETSMDLYIQQDRFREVFAADVAPEVADLMAATQRPIAASALEDVATKAAWKTIPSWTLVTTQDLAIPADSMRFMADRAGSTTVEIDASHAVAVSRPGAVADLIDDAARATTGADLTDARATAG